MFVYALGKRTGRYFLTTVINWASVGLFNAAELAWAADRGQNPDHWQRAGAETAIRAGSPLLLFTLGAFMQQLNSIMCFRPLRTADPWKGGGLQVVMAGVDCKIDALCYSPPPAFWNWGAFIERLVWRLRNALETTRELRWEILFRLKSFCVSILTFSSCLTLSARLSLRCSSSFSVSLLKAFNSSLSVV